MFKAASPYITLLSEIKIDWHPFDKKTLQKAIEEDKLIFIHIGQTGNYNDRNKIYTLFSDNSISKILNKHFISISIDSEDYPEAYLLGWDFLQILNSQQQKPTNIFLMPDFTPITSTSDCNSEDFILLTKNLVSAFKNKRKSLTGMAQEASYLLEKSGVISECTFNKTLNINILEDYTDEWSQKMVSIENYFKRTIPFSIKVPALLFLTDYIKIKQQPVIKTFIKKICDLITDSKMQDKNDGGFFFQMEDLKCETPLYEKKLSENLLTALFLSISYKIYNNIEYKKCAEESLMFIENNLKDENGGYINSISTDQYRNNSIKDIRKITAYNALYISILCRISVILNFKQLADLASKNYQYLEKHYLDKNNHIPRYIIHDESSTIDGTLLDYAEYINATISLYDIFKEPHYLEKAEELIQFTIENFYNENNGMFFKSSKYSYLIPLKRESNIDGYMASANSIICHDLLKLYQITGNNSYLSMAKKQLSNISPHFLETGPYMGSWASQLLLFLKITEDQNK
jgi:uncharacterized protein